MIFNQRRWNELITFYISIQSRVMLGSFFSSFEIRILAIRRNRTMVTCRKRERQGITTTEDIVAVGMNSSLLLTLPQSFLYMFSSLGAPMIVAFIKAIHLLPRHEGRPGFNAPHLSVAAACKCISLHFSFYI